jgi:hypothetical protein
MGSAWRGHGLCGMASTLNPQSSILNPQPQHRPTTILPNACAPGHTAYLAMSSPQATAPDPLSPRDHLDTHPTSPATSMPVPAPPLGAPSSLYAVPSASDTSIASSDRSFTIPTSRASRKRSDVDTDAGSSSPSKRSRISNGSTSFSTTTKQELERLYGTGCWHCPSALAHSAHVMAQADGQLSEARRLGLVGLRDHRDLNNALRLCPNCHNAYDSLTASFIIVPLDLQLFYEAEERWQREYPHTRAARPPVTAVRYAQHCVSKYESEYSNLGIITNQAAASPISDTSSMPGGLYSCYIGLNNFLDRHRGPQHCIRAWHGDPGAIIRHALRRIVGDPQLSPALRGVKRELIKLDLMYDEGTAKLLDPPFDPSLPTNYPSPGSSTGPGRLQSTPHPGLYPSLSGPAADSEQNQSSTTNAGNASGSGQHDPASHSFHDFVLAPVPESPPPLTSPKSRKRKRSFTEESFNRRVQAVPSTHVFNKRQRIVTPSSSPQRSLIPEPDKLYRWGGPHRSTEATIEYWKRVFLD